MEGMLQSVQREKSNASGEVADASRRLDEAAGRVDSLEDENARLQQQLTVARAEVAQHKKVGLLTPVFSVVANASHHCVCVGARVRVCVGACG